MTPPPLLATVTASSPSVPLTDDRVGLAVAEPLPGPPARSRLTAATSVPVRSLTVMVSGPPRALKSIARRR